VLQRIVSSLKYRAKWAQLGVLYGRQLRLDHIKIAGRKVRLDFPPSECKTQEHEFHKIILDDCYRLNDTHAASTILDIGANIGLFALAARNRFPKAAIHCYEPNPAVLPHLRAHAQQIGAIYFPEAVGLSNGKISLKTSDEGSIFSVSKENDAGDIDQCSFLEAVSRLGKVNLLKLDCEGAEWQIFEDRETWKSVDQLVMEYHLWAKANSTTEELRYTLSSLGFTRIDVCDDGRQWGMAFASRQ
jgi:FkbM family methyltransferase